MKKQKISLLIVFAFLACVLFQTPVSAKDEWIRVSSKNFNLVGNAPEKDIRKVATRLEQFRETFRQIFSRANLSSSIPTNVVVFKSDSSYKPFKPKRADGKIDNFVAGYFQPGEDVNYITLSTEGEDADTYGTIFHEYVHFILDINFGKSDVPSWFNEGLAEYYQTFAIEEDQRVKLGLPQNGHLALLQQSKLIPLDTLFKISNYALQQNGNHSRSIFYAQSWALIHYLILTGKSESLEKFINALSKNVPAEKAFQEAFQTNYAQMEKELQKYVAQNTYKYWNLTFKNKLVFDGEMQVSPLSEAESSAYLGDLLYHTNRPDDAEPFLQKALSTEPNSGMANIALGMVKMRQKKYPEAKTYLEKALSADQKNHMAYYRYAFLLSRENQDETGFVSNFSPQTAQKIREMLKKAIAINPTFTESYELYAFISLVTGDELEEGLKLMQTALKHQPGNQRYAMRIAELYLRQDKFPEAAAIADKIARTAAEPQAKMQAERLAAQIRQIQENTAQQENYRKQVEEAVKNSGATTLTRRSGNQKQLSPEEMAKAREEAQMSGINEALRKPEANEQRVIGRIQKIECKGKGVIFSVKTEKEMFTLASRDFESLSLTAYTPDAENVQIGCDASVATVNAVLTYKPAAAPKGTLRGDLVAIDLVPGNFRFVEASQDFSPARVDGGNPLPNAENPPPPVGSQSMMLNAIKSALRKPQPGEKRMQGVIEKVKCTDKGMFFYLKTSMDTIMLSALSPIVAGFTPEIAQLRLNCQTGQIPVSVIFTYKDSIDLRTGSSGELVSLEFVPKEFILD